MPDNLLIDVLRSNQRSRVQIVLPGAEGGNRQVVTAYTRGGFTFGAGSQFMNPEANAGQRMLSKLINSSKQFLNQWFEVDNTQERIQHLGQTVESWIGPEKPEFTIPVAFFAVRQDDDVVAETRKLYRAIYPTAVGSSVTSRFRAPLSYAPRFNDRNLQSPGTLILTVGSWFRATGLLMKNAQFEYSDVALPNGKPVIAMGTVTLTPFRALLIDDVERFFL